MRSHDSTDGSMHGAPHESKPDPDSARGLDGVSRRHLCYDLECQPCQRRAEAADRRRLKRAAQGGCLCGQKSCDCARWERIFREKFQAPDYYERETARRDGSTLAWA